MYTIVFLIAGLFGLSLQAHTEENNTATTESSGTSNISHTKEENHNTASVIVSTDQPVSTSMQTALAAPEDPYVAGEDPVYEEGKDINAPDEEEDDADEVDSALDPEEMQNDNEIDEEG